MPIFSAAKPDEEELEYVRRQSGSESGYIPRVVLPNTRIAPSIQKLVTVTEAPGGPSSIITTEQDFKNPHLDEWMMSLGQIFSKRYGDAPFVGFKTIEEDLLHMCPREEWKHAIPFSILRLRKYGIPLNKVVNVGLMFSQKSEIPSVRWCTADVSTTEVVKHLRSIHISSSSATSRYRNSQRYEPDVRSTTKITFGHFY